MIYSLLKNDTKVCPFCGYKDDEIIDEYIKNYYRIIQKIEMPDILFIGFDLSIGNDINNEEGNTNSLAVQNILAFNRLKDNKDLIINLIKDSLFLYNTKYELAGIVCTPYSGRYSGLIINMKEDCLLLKKNLNYYFDSQMHNNEILEIKDWKNILNKDLPYILIYIKN